MISKLDRTLPLTNQIAVSAKYVNHAKNAHYVTLDNNYYNSLTSFNDNNG